MVTLWTASIRAAGVTAILLTRPPLRGRSTVSALKFSLELKKRTVDGHQIRLAEIAPS